MNLKDALQSGKPFRRIESKGGWFRCFNDILYTGMGARETEEGIRRLVFADDYVLQEETMASRANREFADMCDGMGVNGVFMVMGDDGVITTGHYARVKK